MARERQSVDLPEQADKSPTTAQLLPPLPQTAGHSDKSIHMANQTDYSGLTKADPLKPMGMQKLNAAPTMTQIGEHGPKLDAGNSNQDDMSRILRSQSEFDITKE